MQPGIFTKTFAGTTPLAVLTAARDAGFDCVQYNMACSGLPSLPDHVPDAAAAAVAAAAATTGIAIAAQSATYNMTHPDMATRLAGRASFAALAAAAPAMGIGLLTVCSGSLDAQDQWRHHPDNRSPAAWRSMMEEFGHLIAVAERHDILIGVEPELANIVDSAAAARRMLDTLGSDRIRIVLDPANLFEIEPPAARRDIIAAAVDLLGTDIAMAHAKDRHPDGRFATAGTGVIDFAHFTGCLRGAGFDGPLVAHGLSADEAPAVAALLRGLTA